MTQDRHTIETVLGPIPRSETDLLGAAIPSEPTRRRPVQGDMWGADDRPPKQRRDYQGQTVMAGCEPVTVTDRR